MASPPIIENKHLGRSPRISDTRALHAAHYFRRALQQVTLPTRTHFWPKRRPFPIRSFGNTMHGSCTRSKQAIAAMRMERLETRNTPKISDEEVVRVYYAMTDRLYGGGDTGAYEIDALNEWRNPYLTFKDTKGRPLTIDAYAALNPSDHDELKRAIFLAGARGIAVCLNLPAAFSRIDPPADWDIPEGQALTGQWRPGTWGGHSMWCLDWDEVGFWLPHTWDLPMQRITYRAASVYLDEAHLVIDSVNAWKKRKPAVDLAALVADVNAVSSLKIQV